MTAAEEWTAARERVAALVRDVVAERGEEAMDVAVPACPDWTARELLAHMVGLGADVLVGDEPADHDAAWTQRQVDRRRDLTSSELLDEWDGLAERMLAHLADDPRPLGDAVIHEQDLRGALGRPGARDTPGLVLVRESMAGRFADAVADRPAVELRAASGWTWRSDDGGTGVVLEAEGFDLARALTSRRTAEQLRSYVVAGDVTPYLDAFAQLGPLPGKPLPE